MDFLFNPWVITIVIVCVFVGNIAALKYTATMKLGQMGKKSDLDKQNQSSASDKETKKGR
ncbi:DUF2897 family protein [Vibrio fluvialis]|uniref:DUF2897 family protein n=1 Tax=Vibrio fluvialis TaxID=676 RepID=UPI001ED913AB|nr:DUF2897 family protein [Vibrio fluvialis]